MRGRSVRGSLNLGCKEVGNRTVFVVGRFRSCEHYSRLREDGEVHDPATRVVDDGSEDSGISVHKTRDRFGFEELVL